VNELDTNYHEARVENGNVVVVSEVPPEEVIGSEAFGMLDPKFQRALATWAEDTHPQTRSRQGLFQRNKYVTPSSILKQMALAYDAADDDIVSGVLDTSESISLQKVQFESKEEDEQDVWNQVGADLDLDGFFRTALRELHLTSQVYPVWWWGRKVYRVRGEGEKGRPKRKEYTLTVPTQVGFLDPLRVVPVSGDLFGGTQLAWIADEHEMEAFEDPDVEDQLLRRLFLGPYDAPRSEAAKLKKEDIPLDRLMLLNSAYVSRHTLTKAPFERWANVRMKSVFPLLDLKHQVREMDRAWLLGGINFVVLVTRGSDDRPTNRTEIEDTAAQMRVQSKSPVIVTDHRIKIEIITPDVEHVLDREKWAVLDERIMMRMWGTFMLASDMGGRETSATLGKVIARGLASRRHMMKRMVERDLIMATQNHPDNFDQNFKAKTRIEFAPREIQIDFDPVRSTIVQELRDRGDLSRETNLDEFGFDQDIEAQRREREDEKYEEVFTPVNVPFDSPDKTTPGGSGRQGNRPGEQQGQPAPGER
jgi:hypothetical protein